MKYEELKTLNINEASYEQYDLVFEKIYTDAKSQGYSDESIDSGLDNAISLLDCNRGLGEKFGPFSGLPYYSVEDFYETALGGMEEN